MVAPPFSYHPFSFPIQVKGKHVHFMSSSVCVTNLFQKLAGLANFLLVPETILSSEGWKAIFFVVSVFWRFWGPKRIEKDTC